MAVASSSTPSAATAATMTNGIRQFVLPPSRAPIGTPSTVAIVSPEPTIAIARPCRACPIRPVAVVRPMANSVAWLHAEATRPAITHA